jgi:hypothetical protein
MILLLVVVGKDCVGDEARQDIDGQSFVIVVQCFPRVGLVEKKIEEVQICFWQWSSPSWPGNSPSRF